MSAAPEAYHRLPAEFAAALGHAVAAFGWLEEIMKRTIYTLDRARLADDLSDAEMQRWLRRMSDIADDSMGTLVEQLDAALRRHPGVRGRDALNDELIAIKQMRNLLCHASWRPTGDPGRWHPAFVNTRGEVFPEDMGIGDLDRLTRETHDIGLRITAIMRGTGIDSVWPGDD
ncbi:hypothetical protein PE067_07570 [Paracoccus sp. DMF-8]|uniref:hypothetical protein n=1 Tax=Paracoccus sp. DMF-8 TaxID=3019445 RepID=UPI0023E843B3|nr:hypothetical protein [Paracoccus sp. DMF-8]MDF3606001.1 hypothetical protein [Paracoccus sp. DMF-8]